MREYSSCDLANYNPEFLSRSVLKPLTGLEICRRAGFFTRKDDPQVKSSFLSEFSCDS